MPVSQSAGSSRPPLPSKPTLPRLAAPTPPKAPVPPAPPPKPRVPADAGAPKPELDQSPELLQSQARPSAAVQPPAARLVLKNGAKQKESRPAPPLARGGDVPPLRVAARIRTADSNAASVQSLDQILDRVEKGFQNELNERQQSAGNVISPCHYFAQGFGFVHLRAAGDFLCHCCRLSCGDASRALGHCAY